ncbi:MAG: AAA family ATPase [Thermodesulfobacteriota bacterium]
MPIIAISRGSYSHGKEVAEKVARKLGYACVSREIMLKASKHFNVPEIKLARAVHDAPSIFERLTHGKERYITYVREALLQYFIKDNVVYHGLAGHFFVQGVSHVLKVRILADLEDRVAEEIRRKGVPADDARKALEEDDADRHRWSQYLYGIDNRDPSLYDLVIHLKSLNSEDAAAIICHAAQLPAFQSTPASRAAMEKLLLAAQVQAALVEEMPGAQVEVEGEEIVVTIQGLYPEEQKFIAQVDQVCDCLGGVKAKVRLVSP